MSTPKSKKLTNLDKQIIEEIEKMRPYIHSHGGDINYKSFDAKTGTVEVDLHGTCVGCPISAITLQDGVLETLKLKFPQVKAITISPETFENMELLKDTAYPTESPFSVSAIKKSTQST